MEEINFIQNALFSIDSTKFEVLCGEFLYYHGVFGDIPTHCGKAVAKNRPRKGHPDAYYSDEEKYLYMVCTAVDKKDGATAIVKKVEKDIECALDIHQTETSPNDVGVIHVCLAGKLTLKIENKIKQKFSSYSCSIKFWDGYVISSYIYNFYSSLAKKYLNINVGRKAILPLKNYLDTVGSSPESMLVNPFLEPDNFQEFQHNFKENNILIISGVSGTGKTRIAVELLLRHISGAKKRSAYCIKSNTVTFPDALELDLSAGRENSLLIDDAGRETSNLIRVLEHWQKQSKYIDKLILTTRDYSLTDVKSVLDGTSVQYSVHEVQSHSKEFIEDVIRNQGISNSNQITKLSIIARGRVRMAIMGAQLLKENPEIDLNAAVIYERFFKSIADDKKDLKDIKTQKLLALLYFYKYVDFQDEKCIEDRFSRFNLSEDEMKEKALPLRDAEFLDEFDDIYRVGDQEIGFYHFFKVFIKDKSLSLEKLLSKENLIYTYQLQETLGECFKVFEGLPELDRIQQIIEEAFYQITDEYLQFDFLKVFANQLPEIAYEHVRKGIYATNKETDSPVFKIGNYTSNEYVVVRPKVIEFIQSVISNHIFQTERYWHLYLEFIRRNPSQIDKYLNFIYKRMEWSDRDSKDGYIRQKSMLKVLFDLAKKQDELAILTTSILSLHWLTTSTWLGRSMTAHEFKKNDAEFLEIRKRIWEVIIPYFPTLIDPYTFFYGLVRDNHWLLVPLYSFDKDFIQVVISQYLNPSSLPHGIEVNKLFKKVKNDEWLKRNVSHFISDDVLLGERLLSNSYGRNSDDREFILDKIREFINWDELYFSFQRLYQISEILLSTSADWSVPNSIERKLNALFDYMIDNNIRDFVRCIEYIISQNNSIQYIPKGVFFQKLFERDEKLALEVHLKISESLYTHREQYLIIYYSEIPTEKLQHIHYDTFIRVFEVRKEFIRLSFDTVRKFSKFDPNIIYSVVQLIIKRYKEGANTVCFTSLSLVESFEFLISKDVSIAEELYRILIPQGNLFDHDDAVITLLAKNRPEFIVELVQAHIEEKVNLSIEVEPFHFLFDGSIPDGERYVHAILELYVDKKGLSEHRSEQVFGGISPESEQYKNALSMILNYVRNHSSNVNKMRGLMRLVAKNFEKNWLDIAYEMIVHDFPIAAISTLSFSVGVLVNAHTSRSEIESNQYQLIIDKLRQSELEAFNPNKYYECISHLNKLKIARLRSSNADKRRDFTFARR
jgi:hypothetical protein